MVLYRTLRRMIERGNAVDMEKKLDIFLAADRITTDEYMELTDLLNSQSVTD